MQFYYREVNHPDGSIEFIRTEGVAPERPPAEPALPVDPPYQAKRTNEMHQIGDQLDMIWHDIDNGMFGENAKEGSWYKAIKAIKDKYPAS